MAKQVIEFHGRAKGVVFALVLIVVATTWMAPGVLAQLNVTTGHGWSLLRFGHREAHLVNHTGHWAGAESGYKRSGPAVAFAGERLVVDYAVDPDEGRLTLHVRDIATPILFIGDKVWSREIEGRGRVTVDLPETGFYGVYLSFTGFSGSAEVDWEIE